MNNRSVWCVVGLVISFGIVPATAQVPGQSPLFSPCPTDPPCGSDCSNIPFRPTECGTTQYGPARANIVLGGNALQSPNMLYCPGGTPYALCFFSGPPERTGSSDQNKVLECTPIPGTTLAECQCQVYNSGSYYVDINSILNLGAFYETKEVCGGDGSGCKNIRDCDTSGRSNSCAADPDNPCPPCPDTVAPVCEYIAAQSAVPGQKDFYPKPDLISTFSFAMGDLSKQGPYELGSTPCSGLYAGCMTAPCNYPPGSTLPLADGSIVDCACPLWNGDYQVGQNDQTCPDDAGWVWSAANAVPEGASGGDGG